MFGFGQIMDHDQSDYLLAILWAIYHNIVAYSCPMFDFGQIMDHDQSDYLLAILWAIYHNIVAYSCLRFGFNQILNHDYTDLIPCHIVGYLPQYCCLFLSMIWFRPNIGSISLPYQYC